MLNKFWGLSYQKSDYSPLKDSAQLRTNSNNLVIALWLSINCVMQRGGNWDILSNCIFFAWNSHNPGFLDGKIR